MEMIDGLLLQTIEGLGDAPMVTSSCEIWERLEGEKEEVSHELSERALCRAPASGSQEIEVSEETGWALEWHHRGQLEARFREINDAQDRLMEGTYGRCKDCGAEIAIRRLAADPTAVLCITCKQSAEPEVLSCTL